MTWGVKHRQRIKAARMLTRVLGLANSTQKQKVRGRTVSKNTIDDILIAARRT